jgi:hypothetical protein
VLIHKTSDVPPLPRSILSRNPPAPPPPHIKDKSGPHSPSPLVVPPCGGLLCAERRCGEFPCQCASYPPPLTSCDTLSAPNTRTCHHSSCHSCGAPHQLSPFCVLQLSVVHTYLLTIHEHAGAIIHKSAFVSAEVAYVRFQHLHMLYSYNSY